MANELLQKVIDLTQLPSDEITQELERLLQNEGIDKDRVSLWQLREVLAKYIHEVFAQYEDELPGQGLDDSLKLVTIN